MSVPNNEEVNTSMTGDETHSLSSHEVEDLGDAAASSRVQEEVARQIKPATDPSTMQFEKLCDLIREHRRDTVRRDESTSAPTQGPSGPCGGRYDMLTGTPLTTRSELLTGPMNPIMKQPENVTSRRQQPNRQRRPLLLEDGEEEHEQFNNSPIDHVAAAINNLPHIVQRDAAHIRILNTQVTNFRGSKD